MPLKDGIDLRLAEPRRVQSPVVAPQSTSSEQADFLLRIEPDLSRTGGEDYELGWHPCLGWLFRERPSRERVQLIPSAAARPAFVTAAHSQECRRNRKGGASHSTVRPTILFLIHPRCARLAEAGKIRN